jgi:DNA polymerase III epsilon subunit-like protein
MTFGSRAGDGAKFLVVDVETTGLDPRRDDIVEIAVVRCIPGSGYQPHISALVKPKCPIGAGASEVHGIYDHDVEFEESFEDVAPSIFDFMGGLPICGWNVKFDVSFLNRYKHLYPSGRFDIGTDFRQYCTEFLPGLPNYKMQTVAKHFGLNTKQTHRALDDVSLLVNMIPYINRLR